MPGCATPSWARNHRRNGTTRLRGCMAGRGWGVSWSSLHTPCRPGLRRDDTEGVAPARLHPQQRLPVYLAGARLWQLVDEQHFARIFVRQELCLHIVLQLARDVAFV